MKLKLNKKETKFLRETIEARKAYLYQAFEELEIYYENAVAQVKENPFIKQNVSFFEKMCGIRDSQADTMIKKLKLIKTETLKTIIKNSQKYYGHSSRL